MVLLAAPAPAGAAAQAQAVVDRKRIEAADTNRGRRAQASGQGFRCPGF